MKIIAPLFRLRAFNVASQGVSNGILRYVWYSGRIDGSALSG